MSRVLIRSPQGLPLRLPREAVALAVAPTLRAAAADAQRARLNPFPGRALTVPALQLEQRHRAWHLAQLGRALSAGVIEGLDLSLSPDALARFGTEAGPPPPILNLLAPRGARLGPGSGLDRAGEPLELLQAQEFDLLDLPVAGPAWLLGAGPPPASSDNELLPRSVGTASLRVLLAEGRPVPRVGLLLLQAVEYELLLNGGDSPCERDLEAEAFDDEVRQEAGRLCYYPWPAEWLGLPAPGPQWRSELAAALFARERALGTAMPWWKLGLPLALIAFNPGWQPLWADAAAVRRRGGQPRAAAERLGLAQARVDQLSEALAEGRAIGLPTSELLRRLRWLPPAGLLPADAAQVRAGTHQLPATLRLDAAPVPLEQLDLLLESAALAAPVDLQLSDALRLLVPVPQAVFEPDLLVVERADADGEFARALARLDERRADLLRRRQSLREKARALALALDGPGVPAVPPPEADPQRLEAERSAPLQAAPAGLLHVSPLLAGLHQSVLADVATPLAVPAGAVLEAWVMLNPEQPPRTLMLQWLAADGWEHRAFWGEDLVPWGQPGTASRLRLGDLPEGGSWLRLAVPAAAVGLQDRSIRGIAFTLVDGQAAFGPAGLQGAEPWLTAALLAGGRREGEWRLLPAEDADAPFEPALGTAAEKGQRVVAGLEALRREFPSLRLGRRGAQRSLPELLVASGLRATIAQLKRAVEQSNDAIDLGFVRVQADLYRLRQSVMKQSQATRFAVSPALSQIAEQASAVASREQLAGFYADIKGAPVPAPEPAPRASTTTFSGGFTQKLSLATTSSNLLLAARQDAALAGTRNLAIDGVQLGNVIGGDAITGLAELRNVSIAQRLEQPRAVETKNFTQATRIEITAKLLELELDLAEVQVPGVPERTLDATSGQPKRRSLPLLELGALADLSTALTDPSPDASKADEAHYFLGGVDVADFSIALLRNVEGLTARYRQALQRCEQVRAQIEQEQVQANARHALLQNLLAEARQDMATARALLAEEQARVAALNARRDAVIAEQVRFLAFVRPLQAFNRSLPTRELDNALEPDAVPACLAAHGPPPAALAALLERIRRAPLAWFPAAQPWRTLLAEPLHLQRLGGLLSVELPEPEPLAETGLAARFVQGLQLQRLAPQALASSLAQQREQLWQRATLLDLDRLALPPLASAAARWHERLASVAGCLHARLSQTPARLRLSWAEAFGQFDGAVELADLSQLPRLHELGQELREDIVELAGWLRRQADPARPEAQALMNLLLRVCLLAASQAPTQRLVTGSLLRPLPLLPQALLAVRPHAPLQLGQRAELFEAGVLVAQGEVEDLLDDGQASVRVTRVLQAGLQVGGSASSLRFLVD